MYQSWTSALSGVLWLKMFRSFLVHLSSIKRHAWLFCCSKVKKFNSLLSLYLIPFVFQGFFFHHSVKHIKLSVNIPYAIINIARLKSGSSTLFATY